MSNDPNQSKAPHEQLLPKAEICGRQLIHSWITYGPKQLNDFEPGKFPTGPLQDVAGGVLQGMLHEGVKDIAGLVAYFTNAPDGTRAELLECSQDFNPLPSDCGPLLYKLNEYDRALQFEKLSHRLRNALDQGDSTAEIVRELAEIEAMGDSGKLNLRERAYAMRFDPNKTPPVDAVCMMIGDFPIAARGDLTVPQGKSKVGKSALISAILGAVHRGNYNTQGDTLCVAWKGESTGAIIHLDTEQSRADWHALVCRGITRSGVFEASPRLVSLPLVMFSRSERLAILTQTLAFERESKGSIDLVLIDGVADLCKSPNDETEALELVSQLHALAQEFHCPIVCVLHENPGTDQGKTRGHLGSELNRKAFANIRIDKDGEGVSTAYGTDMRKREIPKEQGFCFAWNDEAGMHTFQGRAAGLKAAQAEEKARSKAQAEWEPIFNFAAASGTNSNCPALTPILAAEAERDMSGTKELTKEATMKKRMQRAESLGILRKADLLHWTLNAGGTSGT